MSARQRIEADARKDPATLEREIEQKRADIDRIVDALEHKLSPGELADHVMSYAKGNGREVVDNFGASLKANPMAALLTSIGLAWMIGSQRVGPPGHMHESTGPGVGERARHATDSARERTRHAADRIGESGRHAADSARHAADRMRRGAHQARQSFDELMTRQPLAAGAIGIAAGALLAALMPPTRAEDEWLGEASDEARDRAVRAAEARMHQAAEQVGGGRPGEGSALH